MEKVRNIHLKIPAGISTGNRLKVPNEGEPGRNKGKHGDLYVVVYTREHSIFQREGSDLILHVDVPFTYALVGENIEIPTIDKSKVKMFIPSGTTDGKIFRLKSRGLPRFNTYSSSKGDLHVVVHLKIPSQISKKALELTKKLAEELKKCKRLCKRKNTFWKINHIHNT